MEITFPSTTFQEAIQLLTRMVAGAGFLKISVTDSGKAKLATSGSGSSATCVVPCKVVDKEGEGFIMPIAALTAAIANRTEIRMKVSTGNVLVTTDKYKALLPTSSADMPDYSKQAENDESQTLEFTDDLVDFISKTIPTVEMKSLLSSDPYIPITVKATAKGAIVVCYDNWRMSAVYSKSVTGECEFTLPANVLSLIHKEFKKGYKAKLSSSLLHVRYENLSFAVALPQPDAQNSIPSDVALGLARSLLKEEGIGLKMPSGDLKQALENMKAVYNKGDVINVSVKDGEANMLIKSSLGKIASSVKAKCGSELKFCMELGVFSEAMTRVKGNVVNSSIVDGVRLVIENDTPSYSVRHQVALLSQE